MFIGKWNKSVILTYVGLVSAALGMYFCFSNTFIFTTSKYETNIIYALLCLVVAGVCDMFDGKVARMCKRTKEEKEFGIQLDSLVDVFNFVALPIVIMLKATEIKWYSLIIIGIFGICGVARLAYFNIIAEETIGPVKYYKGLPVTSSAIIFPVFYLLRAVLKVSVFNIVFQLIMLLTAFLYIYNFKLAKPKGKWYYIFSIGAVILITIFLIIK